MNSDIINDKGMLQNEKKTRIKQTRVLPGNKLIYDCAF